MKLESNNMMMEIGEYGKPRWKKEFYTPDGTKECMYVEEVDYKALFTEKCRQKLNLEKMYNEANQELIKHGIRKPAIIEGGAALAKKA